MRKIYLDRNLQLIFGVTLMAILGVSSIIPAIPNIANGLNIPPAHIGWVISSFTLSGALTAPLVGIFADRFGRKKILVPSLFLFAFAGAACFFATDISTLLVLRFIQGMGAGPLGVLYATLIGDLYEGRERVTAMGYSASVLSVGTAAFPGLGGMLALIGWSWPFLLPLLAIPLGLAIHFMMDIPEPRSEQNFGEYMRAALVQMKTRQALSLFGMTFLTFIVLYGPIVTYLPILLATKFDSNPAQIGMAFVISSMITALASVRLGALSLRFGNRIMLVGGALFYMLSMYLMPRATSYEWTIIPIIFFGFAQGLNIPTIMSMLNDFAAPQQRGAFMATNGTLLRGAQFIAPVLMGGIFVLFGLEGVYLGGIISAAGILLLAVVGFPKSASS